MQSKFSSHTTKLLPCNTVRSTGLDNQNAHFREQWGIRIAVYPLWRLLMDTPDGTHSGAQFGQRVQKKIAQPIQL